MCNKGKCLDINMLGSHTHLTSISLHQIHKTQHMYTLLSQSEGGREGGGSEGGGSEGGGSEVGGSEG